MFENIHHFPSFRAQVFEVSVFYFYFFVGRVSFFGHLLVNDLNFRRITNNIEKKTIRSTKTMLKNQFGQNDQKKILAKFCIQELNLCLQ